MGTQKNSEKKGFLLRLHFVRNLDKQEPSGRKNEKSQWFTLIELLIVISIIAILAGLLLPALNRAKQKAQAIRCLSGVKQISSAQLQYTLESNDFMPATATLPKSSSGILMYWTTLFVKAKYLNTKVLLCPANSACTYKFRAYLSEYSPETTWEGWGWSFPDYGYNLMMGCTFSGVYASSVWACSKPVKLTVIRNPSRKITFADTAVQIGYGDGGAGSQNAAGNYSLYTRYHTTQHAYGGIIAPRHAGTANIACVDGHGEMVAGSNPNLYAASAMLYASNVLGAINPANMSDHTDHNRWNPWDL